MKNGKLEPNDSDTLQSIYNKLTVNGELKEPLTAEEQVLLFSVSKWIKKNAKKDNMTKDCNGCFGAAGDDCQRCQEVDEVTPPKPDITLELAIAAYNTLIDYCKQFDSRSNCGNCIFDQICYPESDETVCTLNFYHICPADWDKITLPSLNGNTVTYIKDGQLKRVTCGRHEEAVEFYEEVRHVQKQ